MKAVKIGLTGISILASLAAWAPAISDIVAGTQCNQAIITAFIVCGAIIGVAALTYLGGMVVRNVTGRRNRDGELIDDEGVWPMLGGAGIAIIATFGLFITSIAATVVAYTTPATWPSTLSGMLMMHAGAAPSALVGQEVCGTTFGFLGLSSILCTIAVLLYNLPDYPRRIMYY